MFILGGDSLPESRRLKTRGEYEKCLSNARKGDLDDFSRVALNFPTFPTDLSYDALLLFTTFLQEQEKSNIPAGQLQELGALSLTGLMHVTTFKPKSPLKDAFSDHIYNNWYRSLNYSQKILSGIRKQRNKEKSLAHFSSAIVLLDGVTDGHYKDIDIFDNSSAQMFSSYVWFYYPNNYHSDRPYNERLILTIMCSYLRKSKTLLDDLLNVVEEYTEPHAKAAAIRRKILREMRYYISLPLAHDGKWTAMTSLADLVGTSLVYAEHQISKALLKEEVLSVLLEGAKQCRMANSSRTGISEEMKEKIFKTVAILLSAVNQSLMEKSILTRKSLQLGLVDVIVTFGRGFETSQPVLLMKAFVVALNSLVSLILHMLDDSPVIMLLAEGLQKNLQGSQDMRENGLIQNQWAFIQEFAIKRATLLRLHRVPEKIALCDTVRCFC